MVAKSKKMFLGKENLKMGAGKNATSKKRWNIRKVETIPGDYRCFWR